MCVCVCALLLSCLLPPTMMMTMAMLLHFLLQRHMSDRSLWDTDIAFFCSVRVYMYMYIYMYILKQRVMPLLVQLIQCALCHSFPHFIFIENACKSHSVFAQLALILFWNILYNASKSMH